MDVRRRRIYVHTELIGGKEYMAALCSALTLPIPTLAGSLIQSSKTLAVDRSDRPPPSDRPDLRKLQS